MVHRTRFRPNPAALLTIGAALAIAAVSGLPQPAGAQAGAGVYVPGQVLMVHRAGAGSGQASRAAQKVRGTITRTFADSGVSEVLLAQGVSTEAALQALRQDPGVALAQPNYLYRAEVTPNDPGILGGSLWGLLNTGQAGGTPNADIRATSAWDLTTGSSSVVVAVIDTGIAYNHPDLAANMWTNPWETPGNGVDDDGNGYVDDVYGCDARNNDGDPFDDHFHGTHCAGTIGAVGNNGLGVVGVAWNVRLVACKFLGASGQGTTAGAVACIDYVNNLWDRGVNVVATSNSWGAPGVADPLLQQAIERANTRGILFVAAAGNAAGNNDSPAAAFWPASFPNSNIISVAATDRNDGRAGFSNYGATTVDLGAPGVEIVSTSLNGTYASASGTSMAAPHVTGAAALLKAYNAGLSCSQVRDALISSGDPVASLAGVTVSGRRLNAANALLAVGPGAGRGTGVSGRGTGTGRRDKRMGG